MEEMSIKDDIAAIEVLLKADLANGPWTIRRGHAGSRCQVVTSSEVDHIAAFAYEAYGEWIVATQPDRIKCLLDALKECQKWHQAARLLHESREAKLSKACELLKEARDDVAECAARAEGGTKNLVRFYAEQLAEIDAFLREAQP